MQKNTILIVVGAVLLVALVGIFFASWGNTVEVPQTSTTTQQVQQNNEEEEQQQPETITVGVGLIALEDDGASGRAIGCDDSVVLVNQEVPYTVATLQAALTRLLSINDASFGTSGLYNALSDSDLELESASIEGGVATVALSGQLSLGGVCDTPRVEAQLEETALQFDTVNSVEIFLNDEPLDEVLSAQ